MADSISTDRAFVEVYETQNFWSVFQPIRDYMFELFFLTILNIYKDYFKGRKKLRIIAQEHNSINVKKSVTKNLVCPSSSFL